MKSLLLLASAALILAGCRPSPGPGSGPGVTAGPYPAGTVTTTGPVPTLVVPTPSAADKSTITGRLQVNPADPRPVVGAILYLAEIIPETSGTPYLAGFERTHSPRTLTDAAGQFAFVDVDPQQYSLVLDRVSEAYLLGHPSQAPGDFIFEAEAGQVLDLGTLTYVSLPGEAITP